MSIPISTTNHSPAGCRQPNADMTPPGNTRRARSHSAWATAIAAWALLTCAACTAGAARTSPGTTAPAAVTLSIVGTNDLHGALLPRNGRGGVAVLGGYLNNLRAARAADGGAVILLDAGDMFQGTLESNLTEGAAVVAAYNALGYTAAAVGNHEFDFGPVGPDATPRSVADDPRGALKARAAEARFPFLAANLIETATGRPPAWRNVTPSTIVDAAGIKVGVIGVMTERGMMTTIASNVGGLALAPMVDTIRSHATALRSAGAAAVIVVAHAGGECTDLQRPSDLSSCDATAEIFMTARALPRGLVDVIVAGHTHAAIAHQVEGIAIVEAYSGGRAFGRVDLSLDRRTGVVTNKRSYAPRDICTRENATTRLCDAADETATLVPATYEGRPVLADASVGRVVAPALEQVQMLKGRRLGVVLATPVRRLNPVSPLGHVFADALLAGTPDADVSLHNTSGGLRADLPAGELTYGSVYEVMPFENVVVGLRLTGRQLRTVFEAHLQSSTRLLGFAGVRVNARCAGGSTEVTMTRPNGAAIIDSELLRVATIDFLALGGDGILSPVMPAGGFPIDYAAPLFRDVVIEHLQRMPVPIREEQLMEIDRPRLTATPGQPLRCGGQ